MALAFVSMALKLEYQRLAEKPYFSFTFHWDCVVRVQATGSRFPMLAHVTTF